MKTDFYVEHKGEKYLYDDIILAIKDMWKEEGKFIKDINTLELYFKPDESQCYYIINDNIKGSIAV